MVIHQAAIAVNRDHAEVDAGRSLIGRDGGGSAFFEMKSLQLVEAEGRQKVAVDDEEVRIELIEQQ